MKLAYYCKYLKKKGEKIVKHFSFTFERYLACLINELSISNKYLCKTDVKKIALSATPIGYRKPPLKYVDGFLKQHDDILCVKKTSLIELGRVRPNLIEECKAFIESIKAHQSSQFFAPHCVINANKTRVDTRKLHSSGKVVASAKQKSARVTTLKSPQTQSIILFVNTAGEVMLNL